MKFLVETLGCKVNFWESTLIGELLEGAGWCRADKGKKPDLIVINTCAVTSRASYQSRQLFRKLKKSFPESKIVVVGCDASFEGEVYEKEGAFRVVPQREKIKFFESFTGRKSPEVLKDFPGRTRAYVKIQDGCDRFCPYCVIPHLRGGIRSFERGTILKQVQAFLERGFKEIVLVGINLGSYGKDIHGRPKLLELVEEILGLPGNFRIRLSSIEPDLFPLKLADLADGERLCRDFHIPLQGTTERMLKAMERRYTFNFYRSLVEEIKARSELITIGTDIIVGYPGEDGKTFLEGLKNIEKLPIDYAHVFPFSPRKGTKAPPKQEGNLKEKVKEILKITEEKRKKHMERHIGLSMNVLSEKETKGITDTYAKVRFEEPVPPNTFLRSKIKGIIDNKTLLAEIDGAGRDL